jgi:hypothetical protein
MAGSTPDVAAAPLGRRRCDARVAFGRSFRKICVLADGEAGNGPG